MTLVSAALLEVGKDTEAMSGSSDRPTGKCHCELSGLLTSTVIYSDYANDQKSLSITLSMF